MTMGVVVFPFAWPPRVRPLPPEERAEKGRCGLRALSPGGRGRRREAPGEGAFAMSQRELIIPIAFWTATYNAAHYPGAPGVCRLEGGANCQQFAYELLRANGFAIGNMRSSELWTDAADTALVTGELVSGDLLLFHSKPEAWGAHVAVYLGEGRAIHIAKRIGKPVIWMLDAFTADPLYIHFIGAKRPVRRPA